MKIEEFKKLKLKTYRRDEEHEIQKSCVKWFNIRYPKLRGLLFAIPNGGRRDISTGTKLKEEGVVAGVSDLLLICPGILYPSLCIEMKTPKGKQQESQKLWQKKVETVGSKYVVCRSLDDFTKAIQEYLGHEKG